MFQQKGYSFSIHAETLVRGSNLFERSRSWIFKMYMSCVSTVLSLIFVVVVVMVDVVATVLCFRIAMLVESKIFVQKHKM